MFDWWSPTDIDFGLQGENLGIGRHCWDWVGRITEPLCIRLALSGFTRFRCAKHTKKKSPGVGRGKFAEGCVATRQFAVRQTQNAVGTVSQTQDALSGNTIAFTSSIVVAA
jgi:hypothetical protein